MSYPVLGWMSRKSLWCVLGTKRTHVPLSIRSIPCFIVWWSTSAKTWECRRRTVECGYVWLCMCVCVCVPVLDQVRAFVQCKCILLYSGENMHAIYVTYSTQWRAYMQCKHIHLQIWTINSFGQNSFSDFCWRRQYLPVWVSLHLWRSLLHQTVKTCQSFQSNI